jgi:hypothetical protein
MRGAFTFAAFSAVKPEAVISSVSKPLFSMVL